MDLASAPSRVVQLTTDPRSDSTIYLVSPGGGIWKSDDGGKNWKPQFDSAYSVQSCSFALDPTLPDVQYVGTGDDQSPRPAQGVARSTDGGRTWSIGVRFTNQPVCALAVDPSNTAHVLAGSAEGLFLSTDSAVTWRRVLTSAVTSISFDRQGSVYAGELGPDSPGSRNNVLVRSSDGGVTWTTIPLPSTLASSNSPTTSVSVLARGNSVFVVVSYNALLAPTIDFYRSPDGGATWTAVPSIGAGAPPVTVLTDADAGNIYVTGTNLLVSQDQGDTWTAVTTNLTRLHTAVFSAGSIVTAGEQAVEIVPLSATAPKLEVILPLAQYLDVTIDAFGNRWAAGPGGLFGREAFVFGTGIGSIAVPATGASQNVFAAANTSVFASTNLGAKITSATVIPPNERRAPFPPLVINPSNPANAFVAGQNLYRTTNSGSTWSLAAAIDTRSNYVVTALTISPPSTRTMYAASACLPEVAHTTCPTASTIWRSQNGGTTWTQMSSIVGYVSRLTGDPRQANTVYAAIGAFPGGPSGTAGYLNGDLLRSTDGGANWNSVRGNLPRTPINAVVIDPTSTPAPGPITITPGQPIFFPPGFNPRLQPAQTIYVGTDIGVFVTFNGGTQWTEITAGLPQSPVTHLSLQANAGTMEASTFGRGAYLAGVKGLAPSLIANPLSMEISLAQGASRTLPLALANVSSAGLTWQTSSSDPWITVPTNTGALQPGGTTASSVQVSSAGLAIGTYLGRIAITNGTLVQRVPVTLHVTTPPARMAIFSGNNASGSPGAALPPLAVTLADSTGAPVPGAEVTFTIASGGGTLSSRSVISDATGTAKTVLTLPNTAGPVQVTASAGTLSATFTASAVVVVAPKLMANSVVNGVTFNAGSPPSPGSIISIFGGTLSSGSESAVGLPLSTVLQGTRVVLATPGGDVPLPLFFVSPQQVNTVLPYDITPGVYTLRVESNGTASNVIPLSVVAFSPGIFTIGPNGQGSGIFLKDDGSLVTATNPAAAGSVLSMYVTGLGAVTPPIEPGDAAADTEPLNRTVQTPRVFFDGNEAEVLYSGLAPGFAGLYQVNVRVPARTAAASNVSVSLSIGGITSNRVAVAVR